MLVEAICAVAIVGASLEYTGPRRTRGRASDRGNMRSKHLIVRIDLDRIRASAEEIRSRTRVPLIAVIKADAYGLGAARVADVLGPVADDFAYFSIDEARRVGRPGLVLGPPTGDPREFGELHLRPSVTSRHEAARFAGLPVAIHVDTGMHWLGCLPDELDDLLARSSATEVFTHAVDASSAQLLASLRKQRSLRMHAAATSLLDCPQAWLDAVRPGLALYVGAVRVSGRLLKVYAARGPVGYTRLKSECVGIMQGGYSNGVLSATAVINRRRQRILEVGMNTCLISVDASDRAGDEVVLLGDGLTEAELASELHVRPHEILSRYTQMGVRRYV
jgi:alanine racemase